MRVLVACERSGAVRSAFRALGHDATAQWGVTNTGSDLIHTQILSQARAAA